jgi:large subunit ribosomal protein L15
MKFNELQVNSKKNRIRAGRGISAGRGKTAGRGTKGQGSRKSVNKLGFEGGQMPLYMRLPKLRGFKSKRDKIEEVYTGQLDEVKGTVIDNQTLFEAGLVASPYSASKLIVRGELKSKKTIKLQNASTPAIEMVRKAGGSFEKINRQGRPSTKKTDK